MAKTEITTMCMIYDKLTNKVLVQNRIKSWQGISFPGGHIEANESIVDSAIREVKEETGLTVSNLEACGIIHWYNDITQDRYFVFNFRTHNYTGTLINKTDEGEVFWVDINEVFNLNLSSGLKERLPMFFDKKYIEGFGIWNELQSSKIKWH